MMKLFCSLIVVLTLALDAPVAAAQVGRGGNPSRQEMVQRIERQFQERLARELALDDSQREDLVEVLRTYATARAELLPRRRELAVEIRQLLEGNQSEDRAAELIRELREIREAESDLLEEEEDQLLDVLRPIQVLRLQVLRDQFGAQIRSLGTPEVRGDQGLRRFFFRFNPSPGLPLP